MIFERNMHTVINAVITKRIIIISCQTLIICLSFLPEETQNWYAYYDNAILFLICFYSYFSLFNACTCCHLKAADIRYQSSSSFIDNFPFFNHIRKRGFVHILFTHAFVLTVNWNPALSIYSWGVRKTEGKYALEVKIIEGIHNGHYCIVDKADFVIKNRKIWASIKH